MHYISELDLGNRQFFTIADLVRLGVFGSKHTARAALSDGVLQTVRISPRRIVVPRPVLVAFLKAGGIDE